MTIQPPASFDEALQQWSAVIGQSHVRLDDVSRREVELATFGTHQTVPVILRPGDTAEVQACLRIASEQGVAVYPISGGKNWGLGSRVPVVDGCALLDLSRLNRILEHDEELAYIRVEAGVTFAQAHAYLAERASRLMLDVPGTSPDASLIGNVLERGHGLGLQADRFAHVCALEVVLADGSVLNTGFSRFEEAGRLANVNRWGVGPTIDGLFSQSGLGVVTRATFWLQPRPSHLLPYFFTPKAGCLPALIDVLRELRFSGIQTSFRFFNDYRMFSFAGQYPFEHTRGVTPLPPAMREKMRAGAGYLADWNGLGAIYASTDALRDAQRDAVRRALDPLVDKLAFLEEGPNALGIDPRVVDALRAGFLGVPISMAISMCYWRKRTPAPRVPDPDRDRCGLFWVCPAVPWTGTDAEVAAGMIEKVFTAHGFEPNIGMLFTTPRCIDVTAAIVYDRDVVGEDERAASCRHEAISRLNDAGYIPYRLDINAMALLPPGQPGHRDFMSRLHNAAGQGCMVAPGRYS